MTLSLLDGDAELRLLSILKIIIKTIIYIYYYKLQFHRKRTPTGGYILLFGQGFIGFSVADNSIGEAKIIIGRERCRGRDYPLHN